jgi:hypothetical protein
MFAKFRDGIDKRQAPGRRPLGVVVVCRRIADVRRYALKPEEG